MSQTKGRIQTDYDTLQSDANAGDRKAFDDVVKNSLKPDMVFFADQFKSVRQGLKKLNMTADQSKKLGASYKSLRGTRKTCETATKTVYFEKVGQDMQTWIRTWMDNSDKVIGRMQNQGYDTRTLSTIVSQAQGNLGKLDTALSSGNADTIQQTMQDIRGEHLHVWARFHGNRLKLYAGRLHSKDVNGTYTTQISQAENRVDEALRLAEVGHKYDEAEFQTVVGDLKSAQDIISETAKSMTHKGKDKGD